MNLTALEISKKLKGTVVGDHKVIIKSLSRIENAEKGSISFLSNNKYNHFLNKTKASVVLISENIKFNPDLLSTTLICVQDAYYSFTKLLTEWSNEKKINKQDGVHPTAVIDSSAQIGDSVFIGSYACIGSNTKIEDGVQIQSHCYVGDNVKIDRNTLLKPRVTVLDDSEIGSDCILHSGVILGSDGFGYALQNDQTYFKTPQLGKVVIKDKVEIGSNTTIDRATLGATIIGKGVKLDNLIQIAHNVEIGSHTAIAAQTGIAGSTKIGSRCVIGGQVGIIGHLKIGNDVHIQGQTGVIKDIPDGSKVQGTPAIDFNSFYKSYALFKSLPKIESRLSTLEKK